MTRMFKRQIAAAALIAAFGLLFAPTGGFAAETKGKSGAPASIEEVVAGKVTRIKGSALAIQDAQPRILSVGAEILLGDIISTGANSRLELRMSDDGIHPRRTHQLHRHGI